MLDQDEIALNWRIDTTPIGRARSRSHYDFDRIGDSTALPGRIAYERLRESEQEASKKRPSLSIPTRPVREHRQRSSEQHDRSPLGNSNGGAKPSTARLRALAEYEAELAKSDAERRRQAKENRLNVPNDDKIELNSFTVRYENSSGHLLCEWVSPDSSSGIDYYTIERQLGNNEWLPVGEKINKSQNLIQLNSSSLSSGDENLSSRFRLKAYLNNGETLTSKPTDEILIDSTEGNGIIIPDVEILSADSVELTWKNNEDGITNFYDIEKKDSQQTEWEKVTKVSLSQGSARVDHLNDSQQCQFRLVPSTSEKQTKPGKTP
jgi:hypothetical protein